MKYLIELPATSERAIVLKGFSSVDKTKSYIPLLSLASLFGHKLLVQYFVEECKASVDVSDALGKDYRPIRTNQFRIYSIA